jgi:hypothetical protein
VAIKQVAMKRWVYTLYDVDGQYVLSVAFCNGPVDYSRAFKVDSENLSEEFLTALSSKITSDYDKYKELEVPLPELEG